VVMKVSEITQSWKGPGSRKRSKPLTQLEVAKGHWGAERNLFSNSSVIHSGRNKHQEGDP